MKYCPVCRGQRKIAMPLHVELTSIEPDDEAMPNSVEKSEIFDCPKCVPSVPYRRVRAKKVISTVDAEDYGKFQMPLQRQLAQKFGEYLLREGLLWFTTDNIDGEKGWTRSVTVYARCNVVDRNGGEISGAEQRMEVADAEVQTPNRILEQIARRRAGLPVRDPRRARVEIQYDEPEEIFKPEALLPKRKGRDVLRAQREKAEAMGERFSGLELDSDD